MCTLKGGFVVWILYSRTHFTVSWVWYVLILDTSELQLAFLSAALIKYITYNNLSYQFDWYMLLARHILAVNQIKGSVFLKLAISRAYYYPVPKYRNIQAISENSHQQVKTDTCTSSKNRQQNRAIYIYKSCFLAASFTLKQRLTRVKLNQNNHKRFHYVICTPDKFYNSPFSCETTKSNLYVFARQSPVEKTQMTGACHNAGHGETLIH